MTPETRTRPAARFARPASASDLARRLAVSKQAAAKSIIVLEQCGYVGRADDPNDARRKLLTATTLGYEVMRQGEEIELARLEANLVLLVGASPVDLSAPGSIARDTGESTVR
jgi:DNA-binding MarR family transcriptional regulator